MAQRLSQHLHELNPAARHSANPSNDPLQWPSRRKWRLTGFACFLCIIISINALSITSASDIINKHFNVSDATFPNSYWAVTAWNGGGALFPIILLPLMESYGLRYTYLVSHVLKVTQILLICFITGVLHSLHHLPDTTSSSSKLCDTSRKPVLRWWICEYGL